MATPLRQPVTNAPARSDLVVAGGLQIDQPKLSEDMTVCNALFTWIRSLRKKPEPRLDYDWFLDEPAGGFQQTFTSQG